MNRKEFFDKIRTQFRTLHRTTVPFPSDEEVTRVMNKRRDELIATINNPVKRKHFAQNTKIGTLRLPDAFRTGGIFGHYFGFGGNPKFVYPETAWDHQTPESQNYRGFTCVFDPWMHIDDELMVSEHYNDNDNDDDDDDDDDSDDDADDDADDDLKPPILQLDPRWNGCMDCKEPGVYHQVDDFFGFGKTLDNMLHLCEHCHEQRYSGTDLLATLAELTHTKNVNNLIQQYTIPVPTLRRVDPDVHNPYDHNEYRLISTTHVFDWVAFMYYSAEEDSVWWLVNCNPDNKFYGHVLESGHQGELFLVGTIEEFSASDTFLARTTGYRTRKN